MALSNTNKINELTQAVFERFPLYQARVVQLNDTTTQSEDHRFRYAFGRYVNFTFFDLRKNSNDDNFLLMGEVISGVELSLKIGRASCRERVLLLV